MKRIRQTQARRINEDIVVFIPSEEDLKEIIPHGNRVKIKRIEGYDWLYGRTLNLIFLGTKRFKFTKDKEGNIYATTKNGDMLFDDFISINQMSEFKKARKHDTRNLDFSNQDQEFNEADFAQIGNELEDTDQSDSIMRDFMKRTF